MDYDARVDVDHSVDVGMDEGVDVDVDVHADVDVDVDVDVGVEVDVVDVGVDVDGYVDGVDGVDVVVDFLFGQALSLVLGVMFVHMYRKMWSLLVATMVVVSGGCGRCRLTLLFLSQLFVSVFLKVLVCSPWWWWRRSIFFILTQSGCASLGQQ